MDRSTLEHKPVGDLREIAASLDITGVGRLRKADLIDRIIGEVTGADASGSDGADDDVSDASADGSVDSTGDGSYDEGSDGSADASNSADDDSDDSDDSDDEGQQARQDTSASGRSQARDEVIERRRARARGGRPVEAGPKDSRGAAPDRGDSSERPDRPDRSDRPERSDRGERPERDDDQDDRGRGGNRNRNRNRSNRGSGEGDDLEIREGILDLLPEGYGFLRTSGYVAGPRDVYVSQSYVRRFNLRRGDMLGGPVRFNKGNDKFPALARLETCEGYDITNEHDPLLRDRPEFADLTPVFPDERLEFASTDGPIALRIADLAAPMGKGQRALVIAPPKAGTTTFLQQLAAAVEDAEPDVHVMVLLVDARPEEVTDFERACDAELIASTFDNPAEDHASVAELALERAKRRVERGQDVVMIVDSLTRLGRAYDVAGPASGRTTPSGLDLAALYPPKRLLGAARNVEGGGSLTIVASAQVDTGSPADAEILTEFLGAGNLELRLVHSSEDATVFPAIDVTTSGTRREELLMAEDEVEALWALRRSWRDMSPAAALGTVAGPLASSDAATFLRSRPAG